MRSSQLSLEKYNSDKIANHYLEKYDPFFQPLVEKNIALLELGIYKGGSLLLWKDYFPNSVVAGIDIKLPKDFTPPDRVSLFEGSQADTEFLSQVANSFAPKGFDIIIDDASHVGELTKIAFWHLFDHHLKPGGIYVIEDWGTGYWDDWSDGKSMDIKKYTEPINMFDRLWHKISARLNIKNSMPNHSYGMVGFIKQLVDEQGAQSATRKNFNSPFERGSKFESITITPPIVFIKKAA